MFPAHFRPDLFDLQKTIPRRNRLALGSVNNEEALDVKPDQSRELFVPLFFRKQTII